MQCFQCNADLAAGVDVCARCAAERSPRADKNRRNDISWLRFTLIFLPALILAGSRIYNRYPGAPWKAQGVIMGTAVVTAVIAWLIYKRFNARFRLTWAVTYAVLVVVGIAIILATQLRLPASL
jgi:hypothetical protein